MGSNPTHRKHKGQGNIVDTAGTPEAAFELARAVAQREQVIEREREQAARADYEAWYEAELARRDAEVAGFEMEHERVEEAATDTQNRGVLGMPAQEGVEVAVDPEVAAKIQRVLDARNEQGNPHVREVIGKVTDWVADEVKQVTGIDVSGYRHVIDVDAIRHILEEHGDDARERLRGQIGITEADIQRIPEVIAAPTRVESGKRRKNGQQAIVFERVMADGTVYYVETVGSQKKHLLAQTMYKKIPRTVDASSDSRTRPPNVQAGAGIENDGAQQSGSVNSASTDVLGSPLQPNRPNAARVSFEGEAAQAGTALAKRSKPVSAPEVMEAVGKGTESRGAHSRLNAGSGILSPSFKGHAYHYGQ